jgi:hypothetical protein
MPTPAYFGKSQPLADNGGGWLGRFGSLLGSNTPAYAGDGQPSSMAGMLGGSTPAYVPAPSVKQSEQSEDQRDMAEVQASCPIDPEALAAGQIAIVIPRQQ